MIFRVGNALAAESRISCADGAEVAKLVVENGQPGFNSVPWNGDKVPSGRYMVSIEHNGTVSGKNTVLK